MCNSKYQEALDILHGFANGNLIRETTCDYQRDKNDEYKDTLQELVDKATPKKSRGIKKDRCPICGSYNELFIKRRNTVEHDVVYCWHCGNAIEIWSDEDDI